MVICFHFADTLLATLYVRSGSSGSLSSPAYLLPKPASEEIADKLMTLESTSSVQKDFRKQITHASGINLNIPVRNNEDNKTHEN